MKFLPLVPVALVLLASSPPASAGFHWAPWTATGVATGPSGSYAMTITYHGETFSPYPHLVTITLTGATTVTRSFYAVESFPCGYAYGNSEYLCVGIAPVDGTAFTGSGFQDATHNNQGGGTFTQAVYGTLGDLTWVAAAIGQPF